jgi:hypothetical protein
MAKWNRDKRPNNDLQSITQKTIDQAIRIPLKTGVNSGAPEGYAVPAPMLLKFAVMWLWRTNKVHTVVSFIFAGVNFRRFVET